MRKERFVVPKLFIAMPFVLLLMTGCSSGGDDAMDVGSQFVESVTYAEMTDSVTLNFSTFQLDSLKTSGTSVGLVGRHYQKSLGTVGSTAFFTMTCEDNGKPDEKEILDSLTLVLHYTGYSLGDTMQSFKLDAYRLVDSIQSLNHDDSDVFYNKQSFKHDETPLISHSFMPKPNEGRALEIKLSSEFANEIWSFMTADRPKGEFSSEYIKRFESMFKGLALKGDDSNNNAVLGFAIKDTMTCIKIYSHIVTTEQQDIIRKINVKSSTYQFNNIQSIDADYADLLDKNKISGKKSLNEKVTGGMSFIQAGTGLMTRIDIPYAERLVELKDQGRIVRALLYIKPAAGTYDLKYLPSQISLAMISSVNNIESFIKDSNGAELTGNLVKDGVKNENTYYSYDVTSFINSMVNSYSSYKDYRLALTIPSSQLNQSVDALVVGGFSNAESQSYLKIFYYNYDLEQR